MTNAQTCLYLLKCARMTMLTAWTNIRKLLLHLMLLAELFSKGRDGKIVMLPWASGWSGRDLPLMTERCGKSLTPCTGCPCCCHPALSDLEGVLHLSVRNLGDVHMAPQKEPKWQKLYILLVRSSWGCTSCAQCELPATANELHAW